MSERTSCDGCLSVSDGDKLLGSEVEILVYETYGGFDPDSFAAALGALRGGGLFLLLTPPLERWPQLPDPQASRLTVHPFSAHQVTGRFLTRFVRALDRSHGLVLVSESTPIPHPKPPSPFAAAPAAEPVDDCRTTDQARAVEAILETARGRTRRPLVLTSDRGRGKSSALGIAVARLLASQRGSLLVTAPRRSAVEPLFHHAVRLLPAAEFHRNSISYSDARLEFLPPDALCRTGRHTDLLLIDEAAGIPAPLLERLLKGHPRIVFATTVQGYEGTGRGFEVRFRGTLDRLTPSWRELRMETPIRWTADDPLEQFAARALLLDAMPAEERQLAGAHPGTCRFQLLDRDALARDETRLSQLFGLLILAHYQTRPMDLRHLLDGPNIRVYSLTHQGQVTATAMVAIEGGFEPDLTRDIFEGRRRPRGHLLPQTLCAHAGIREAAALGFARVIRIAVHPAAQGRGLGKYLLDRIADDAQALGMDLAGSSFGATSGLLDFWGRCGFLPVHLGTSRNAASGAHAGVVLRPLSAAGKTLQTQALERLGTQLPLLLGEPLRDLEPAIAIRLFRNLLRNQWAPGPRDRQELEAFAYALRCYEAVLPALTRLASAQLGEALRLGKLSEAECRALICKVLQHRAWGETAEVLGLTGRAQVVAMLRTAAGKLLEEGRPGPPRLCERGSRR